MKVLVIGAGPAGLSAAYNAARDGYEVLVFEKNGRLGTKPCGEAMAKETLEFIDMEPSKRFIENEAKSFHISYKGRFIKEAPFEDRSTSPGYIINKPLFLETARVRAEESGAKVLLKTRVEATDPSTGKVRLDSGEVIQGDLIVCADGLGSVARSHLDYSNYRTATCLQCYCSLPVDSDPERLCLDIIGEGYAWAFPKKDCLNVGVGLPSDSPSVGELKCILDRYIERLVVKPLSKISAASVSIGGPLNSFRVGKLVVAGESAGCVMPLSGEGIRFGAYCGSIVHKPGYRDKFMKIYGKKMKNSRRMLTAIESLNDGERADLLERLEDPMRLLEGELPRAARLIDRPGLMMKLARVLLREDA